jgi:hypothetical protein
MASQNSNPEDSNPPMTDKVEVTVGRAVAESETAAAVTEEPSVEVTRPVNASDTAADMSDSANLEKPTEGDA